MSDATKAKRGRSAAGEPLTDASAPPAHTRVSVDDSSIAAASYANFCRVTGTPEALIIAFGLNAQPFGTPTEPVTVTQRIVANHFTAKRLLHALHLSVQRHEQAFGILETDVNKRVVHRPQD
jgi:hypothetical protein